MRPRTGRSGSYASNHAGMEDKLQKRLENEEKSLFRRQSVLQSRVPDATASSLTYQQYHRTFTGGRET